MVAKFISEVLAGSDTRFAVAHCLGTSDVIVGVRDLAGNSLARPVFEVFSEDVIMVHFDEPPLGGAVVLVIG